MKRRKRQLNPLFDWSRIPTTPVKDTSNGYETWSQFRQREEREAREGPLKAVQAVQAQVNVTFRELQKHVVAFWSRPIEEVQKDWSTDDRGTDLAFIGTGLTPPQDKQAVAAVAKQAFDRWFAELPKTEFNLAEESGGWRVGLYGMRAAFDGFDMSNPAAWQAAFDRLLQLEVFAPGEVLFDQSKVAPEPEPAPLLTERQQVIADFHAEVSPLHQEWLESLYNNFGFSPSTEDLKHLYGPSTKDLKDMNSRDPKRYGWFYHNNLSLLDRRSFDAARRHMVATGKWPRTLLTEDELLSQSIEANSTPTDRLGHAEKSRIMASLQRLR